MNDLLGILKVTQNQLRMLQMVKYYNISICHEKENKSLSTL